MLRQVLVTSVPPPPLAHLQSLHPLSLLSLTSGPCVPCTPWASSRSPPVPASPAPPLAHLQSLRPLHLLSLTCGPCAPCASSGSPPVPASPEPPPSHLWSLCPLHLLWLTSGPYAPCTSSRSPPVPASPCTCSPAALSSRNTLLTRSNPGLYASSRSTHSHLSSEHVNIFKSPPFMLFTFSYLLSARGDMIFKTEGGRRRGQQKMRWLDGITHHRLNGHESEQTLRDGDGQASLACYSPWGHKESDTTEQLN